MHAAPGDRIVIRSRPGPDAYVDQVGPQVPAEGDLAWRQD